MKLVNTNLLAAIALLLTQLSGLAYSQYDLAKKIEAKESFNISRARIKSMTQYVSNIPPDNENSKGSKVLYNEFDSTGRCCHWIKFLSNGNKIEEWNTFRFDNKGRVREMLAWGPNKNLDNRLISIYNNVGLEIETDKILPDSSIAFKWIHLYDPKGRETESVTYQGKDTTRLLQSYKYNDAEHTIETLYMRGETITYRVVKEYDKNGNMIQEKQFRPNGNLTRREENKYDGSGNRLKNSIYNGEGKLISRSDYGYDSFGNLKSENSFNSRNNTITKTIYEYEFF